MKSDHHHHIGIRPGSFGWHFLRTGIAEGHRAGGKTYRIESELRRRKNGREVLAKWFGYPESFNSWIDARTFCVFTTYSDPTGNVATSPENVAAVDPTRNVATSPENVAGIRKSV